MHVTVGKGDLLRCLALSHQVADRRGAVPILSNILLKASAEPGLTVSASDLFVSMTTSIKAEVKEEGAVAIPAKTLFALVKNLPEAALQINQNKHGTVEVQCGRTQYKLPGLAGDEYPALPTIASDQLTPFESAKVADLIAKTHYAISSDETRPHLSSALFECEGKQVRMVATDGHRLCKAEYEEASMKNPINMLIPMRGVNELRRLLDEVKKDRSGSDKTTLGIARHENHGFFSHQDLFFSVKLSDEQFLPYAKVIPQNHQRRIVINRQEFLDALRRISVVSGERNGAVKLQIDGQVLIISCENAQVGEGKEVLDIEGVGEPLAIGFNARYMIDVLSALEDDQVVFELNGEFDPGAIKPLSRQDFVGVVMPMRI